MKDFLKKSVRFTVIFLLTHLFFSNLILFKEGKIFNFGIDDITILIVVTSFIFNPIFIGILKFISTKVDGFIYNSEAFIGYSAIIHRCIDWVPTLFLGWVNNLRIPEYPLMAITQTIVYIYFVLMVLAIYRFWAYHIEIAAGTFLGAIFYSDILNRTTPFGIKFQDDWRQGLAIIAVIAIFLVITISLRRMGVYDFRSRKDKWQETMGEGPYRRLKQKGQIG